MIKFVKESVWKFREFIQMIHIISCYLRLFTSFSCPKRNFLISYIWQWSITNWRFEFNNTLKSNTIRCEKLATIVSGRKNVERPFVRRKQVSTSTEMLMPDAIFHFLLMLYNSSFTWLAIFMLVISKNLLNT